ncbi:IS110 family transposase [Cerasicoccus fimbriatus]|uniref:IS110 family transposase n=1 Tax=Cerasicoccus fimbriatus TaxID=3014554 RepID=UPI0022B45BF5|nr:IS110 family transposase [Cerasicoccus sp. TK19100]
MNSVNYIAIDISKDSLQVKSISETTCLPYSEPGLARLRDIALKYHAPLVVCEATGGYERTLLDFLHERSIAVALVNPARVRAFARSEGINAKTDPIDAEILLNYAQEKKPLGTPPPAPGRAQLTAWLDRRSQLTEQLAREKNRMAKCVSELRDDIRAMVDYIETRLKAIEDHIRKLLQNHPEMSQQAQCMQAIKGIGETTAWTILGYLGEVGSIGRNQLVALAGLAPFNRDSGLRQGKRSIYAGRAKVRKCLYMAATCAAVHNPVIKKYVEGLRKRGKPYKCAIVAAMRKLLIHIQSVIKTQQLTLA